MKIPFGRNKFLPINLLKSNPSSSPGLHLNKTAITKSTSYDSVSATLNSLTLSFSPMYSFFRVNIVDSIPLAVKHIFECFTLATLHLVHQVLHSLKASLSNDSTPTLISFHTSTQRISFHASIPINLCTKPIIVMSLVVCKKRNE